MLKRIFFLIVSSLLLSAARAGAEDISIIVHPDLEIDSLSLKEVNAIYLGEIEFLGKKRVKPIDQKESQEIRKVFLKDVLHISKTDYTRRWTHLIFMGGTTGPMLKENSQEVIRTVQTLEGAIGYVWANEAAKAAGVKTVLTLHSSRKMCSACSLENIFFLQRSFDRETFFNPS